MTTQPANPVPATLMAAVRYIVAIVVPYAIGKGWIDAQSAEGIAALAASLVTVGYGLYKTHDRQRRLVS